jgi:hypothetical protein
MEKLGLRTEFICSRLLSSELLCSLKEGKPGIVVHTCSPSYSGGCGRRITEAQELEVSLGNMVTTPSQ